MTDRYSRQVILPEVGDAGQDRLRSTSVLIVGAGGLGCAVLPYLCAAGIGRVTLVDQDTVAESNLHRQPLYRMSDLGLRKVDAACAALLATNPEVEIRTVGERLTPSNVSELLGSCDIAVDAADSFAVTYTLSDECHRVSKPLISASVLGLSGYVGGFCGGAPSYRAVFPEMPRQAGSCESAGVLGTAVGVMGTLQAHAVLAFALGPGPAASAPGLAAALPGLAGWPTDSIASPLGRLLTVDFRTLRTSGFSFNNAQEPEDTSILRFIAPDQVTDRDFVFDLRQQAADEVERSADNAPADSRIVLCCRSGVRAWRAARSLERRGRRNLALIAFGE